VSPPPPPSLATAAAVPPRRRSAAVEGEPLEGALRFPFICLPLSVYFHLCFPIVCLIGKVASSGSQLKRKKNAF
jgi:hypothetical protein